MEARRDLGEVLPAQRHGKLEKLIGERFGKVLHTLQLRAVELDGLRQGRERDPTKKPREHAPPYSEHHSE